MLCSAIQHSSQFTFEQVFILTYALNLVATEPERLEVDKVGKATQGVKPVIVQPELPERVDILESCLKVRVS